MKAAFHFMCEFAFLYCRYLFTFFPFSALLVFAGVFDIYCKDGIAIEVDSRLEGLYTWMWFKTV